MGRCIRPEIPECNYAARSRPVCGSDRLTYLNAAMVMCKNKLQSKKRSITSKIDWQRAFNLTLFCFFTTLILEIKIIGKGPCSKKQE